MSNITKIWEFIIDNRTASVITLLSFILAIITLLAKKRPIIEQPIIKPIVKVVKKIKKVISPTADDWFKYGEKAQKQNKPDKALKNYNKAVELKPDFFNAYLHIGTIYIEKHKYFEAKKNFQKAIDNTTSDAEINMYYLFLGIFVFPYVKDFDEAIRCLENGINFFNKEFENAQKEIEDLQKKQELNDREKDTLDLLLQKIQKAATLLIEAYYHRGMIYQNYKDYDKALKCFMEVINYDKNYAEAYYQIGIIYCFYIPDYDKSVEYLKKYIELKKDNEKAYSILGLLYSEEPELDNLIIGENQIADKNIDNKIITSFRQAKKLNANNTEAIRYLEKSIELKRDYAMAYFYLGNIYHYKQDYIAAIFNFRKAIEFGYYAAYEKLGKAYYKNANSNEDYDKALEYLNKFIEYSDGWGNEFIGEIYAYIGSVYYQKSKYYSIVYYDSAIAYFQKAIELKTKMIDDVYFCMGLAFIYKSTLNENIAIGIKHIQQAAESGLIEAQQYLKDNENLVLKASEVDIAKDKNIIFSL
ncbi:MAG: tetratricopeptide repeat protein [Prevotellaceae bacterium]|jgi:tetratricopeptide (TPR) repeat protein|nr:tetratricopeptide repeat protein [Prevotellaceae bacterium]